MNTGMDVHAPLPQARKAAPGPAPPRPPCCPPPARCPSCRCQSWCSTSRRSSRQVRHACRPHVRTSYCPLQTRFLGFTYCACLCACETSTLNVVLCCVHAAGGEGISRPTTAPSSDERRSRLSLGAPAPLPVLLPELLGGIHHAMSSPTGPSGAAAQLLQEQQQHPQQQEAVEAAGDEVADVSLAGSFRRTRKP